MLLGLVILLSSAQFFAAVSLAITLEDFGQKWHLKSSQPTTIIMRFVCGIVMHIYVCSSLKSGLTNIKYAVNHSWKFERLNTAIFSALLQFFVHLVILIITFVVLMASNSPKEIVLNFFILVIIARFDDFFYSSFADSTLKGLISGESIQYADLFAY